MKQLSLPFFEDELEDELFIYELFACTPGNTSTSGRVYRSSVDFTLAKSLSNAEDFFLDRHPGWWRTMGVKRITPDYLTDKIIKLETQLETCKFIAEAYNIIK